MTTQIRMFETNKTEWLKTNLKFLADALEILPKNPAFYDYWDNAFKRHKKTVLQNTNKYIDIFHIENTDCTIHVTNEMIKITGDTFEYSFHPNMIMELQKRLNKIN